MEEYRNGVKVARDVVLIDPDIDGGTIDDATITGGTAAPDILNIPEGTPVNAVAASKVLTIGTNPVEGATVSAGGEVYKFRATIGAGVKALQILTFNSELPHDGDTVQLGLITSTYTFKTALTGDGSTGKEVLIEAAVTDTIDNLVNACMGGAGGGTKFSSDCPDLSGLITATKGSADTFRVEYNVVGFLGNSFDTLGTLTHATWGGATLLGGEDAEAANDVLIGGDVEGSIDNLVLAVTAGAGEGTNYGTGTVANTLVTAVKTTSASMTATNKIKGVVGNATALAETLADGSWAGGATFLSGGIDGTVAAANTTFVDATYIYHTPVANTIADANWIRIPLTIEAMVALKLAKASNLSDVADAATAFANIKQAATTSATGVVELSLDAEAVAKAAGDKALVPSNIPSIMASPGAFGGTLAGTARFLYDEDVEASTDTLSANQCSNGQISNYGQTDDCTITLPAAAAGMNFDFVAGTTVAKYLRIDPNASDSIYLDAATTGDGKYVYVSSIAIGNAISFRTFQTGASSYDWMATTISGPWLQEA